MQTVIGLIWLGLLVYAVTAWLIPFALWIAPLLSDLL
jgi:hypothetical protein